MKTLTRTSVVSVLCAVSVWLFVAPQLVTSGMVEPGPYMELMVVLPTLVGPVAALIGAVAGAVVLARRTGPGWAGTLMTAGHVLTVGLAVAVVVWATAFASTGWELLLLPASLMFGQPVTAFGLGLLVAGRRRARLRAADPTLA